MIPGGLSAPVLTAEMVEKCTLDYESLAGLGSMLGSGGITVLDEEVDMMSAIYNTMRFYHHESCGQCTPCREGTGWLEKVAHRFHQTTAMQGDVDLLADIAEEHARPRRFACSPTRLPCPCRATCSISAGTSTARGQGEARVVERGRSADEISARRRGAGGHGGGAQRPGRWRGRA